jgi:hypothetical protein
MNFEQAIARLSVLLPSIDLLKFLTDKALIAGGSVVYALNDFVPVSTVGDIDVFVPSVEIFEELQTVISNYFSATFTPMGFLNQSTYSIVNVKIEDISTEIQLIYKPYKDPNEILDTFDLDYVQCGLFNGTIIETPRCQRSHRDRCINEFLGVNRIFRKRRINKALKKGFKCPLIEYDQFESENTELTKLDSNSKLQLVPLVTNNYSSSERISFKPKWFKMASLVLTKIFINYTGKLDGFGDRSFSDLHRCLVVTAESVDGTEKKDFNVTSISYTIDICRVFQEQLILMPNPLMIQRVRLIPSKIVNENHKILREGGSYPSNPVNDYWKKFDPHALDEDRMRFWEKSEESEYKSVNQCAIEHCDNVITKTILVTPYYEQQAFDIKRRSCQSTYRKGYIRGICDKNALPVQISPQCVLYFANSIADGVNEIPLKDLDEIYDDSIVLYLNRIAEAKKKMIRDESNKELSKQEFAKYIKLFEDNYDSSNKNKALLIVAKAIMDDMTI